MAVYGVRCETTEDSAPKFVPVIKQVFMLKTVSWNSFFVVILILSICYYLGVGIYFRKYLSKALKGKKRISQKQPALGGASTLPSDDPPVEFVLTEKAANDLKQVLLKVAEDKVEREDVLLSVKNYLKKVVHLKNTPYGLAINNLIVSECRDRCQIDLSADEVRSLWER